jgi:Ca-activated chloride channel family protein
MDIRPSFMVSAAASRPARGRRDRRRSADHAEVEVKQVYRNDEATNIEAVYTFPLPLDAVLLHLEVTIGERVLRGTVVEKKAAEEQYENAIADGDSAVMLEEGRLYTMNVGNVMPASGSHPLAARLCCGGRATRPVLPPRPSPPLRRMPLAPHQAPRAPTAENRLA